MIRLRSSAGRTMAAGRCASAAMQCQRIAQLGMATVRAMSTATAATNAASPAQQQRQRRQQQPVRQAQTQTQLQPPPQGAAASAAPAVAAAAATAAGADAGASPSARPPRSGPGHGGPFRSFWLSSQPFLPPGWLDKQRSDDSLLGYEAKLRRETRATLTLQAEGARPRPLPAQMAELQRLYDDAVHRNLPHFDMFAAAAQAPQPLSPAERAAALVARLHSGTDGVPDEPPAQQASATFFAYTSATHALLRLAAENPPPLSSAAVPDALSSSAATDPLYSLQLLQRYWTNIFSPASPFRSLAPTLHWWAMMAAVHVLVGCAARNPAESRVALIRALLERMRALQLVPQPGVEGTTGSLYDYAVKHEAFFRTLLFAAMRAPDQSFAATLLPQIVHLAHPHRAGAAPSGSGPGSEASQRTQAESQLRPSAGVSVVWKPVPRFVQTVLFEQFMANCCAHIFAQQYYGAQQQQPPSAESDRAAAAAESSQPLLLPQQLHVEFARATLLSLFPDMAEMLELVTLEHGQWSQPTPPASASAAAAGAGAAAASSGAAAPSSSASVQDIVFHAFRCLSSTPLALSIRHYNFLLFALTHMHAHTRPSHNNNSNPAHGLIVNCVKTIIEEGAVHFDLVTAHILLHYCLRGYDGVNANVSANAGTDAHAARDSIGADRASLLRLTLAQLHRLLSSEPATKWVETDSDEQGPPLSLTPVAAQFLVHASHAQARQADPRTTPEQLAEALLRAHFHWQPLLGSPAAVGVWNSAVVRHLAALGSWTQLRLFLSAHGADLAAADMRAIMESCGSPDVFRRADQWAHSSAAEQLPTSEPNANDAPAAAPTNETAVAAADASASATPAASPSMSVSHTLLRWEEAKAALSPARREWLGLPALESGGVNAADDSPFVAREMEAAKYVVYHSRKLQLEKGAAVDAPLGLPSQFTAPALELPAAVLAAPNFSTGWLLMCSAWVQHRGEEHAIRSIKKVLTIVALAASGSARWQEQLAESAGAQQNAASAATAVTAGAAPSGSPASPSASSSKKGEPGVPHVMVRSVLGWLDKAGKSLVSDLGASVHVFTPVPPAAPLLDSRAKFRLHPQLLHSVLYSFQFFERYRTNSAPWIALFKQLVRMTPLAARPR